MGDFLDTDYDVIVIGAGPGGCHAAKTAAENGVRVLLVEKRQEIGAPKRCGEGLSLGGMKNLGLKPDKKWTMHGIKGASVYAPNGRRISIRYENIIGYVIERKMFDKYLAIQAARAGAKVLAKTAVSGLTLEDGFVKGAKFTNFGEKYELTSKIVVAADGVESKAARWAGINTTNRLVDIDSGFQYEMVLDLDEPDMLELYFGSKVAPRGYVWIFPKGKDVANVGVGIGGREAGPAKKYLDKFIREHPNLKDGSIIEVNAGGIPVGDPVEKLAANGFMIVGDAAHQVNAIHGGGIHEASVAGMIAGRVAAEAVKAGDCSGNKLAEYEREWRSKRGKILHKIVKLRQTIEKLPDEDLNMLAENLTGEDLVEFAKGRRFLKLAKILMRRPHLMQAARILI